ncbi:MAG: peptide-binding protein [Candidatus Omnitrophota bacterium]
MVKIKRSTNIFKRSLPLKKEVAFFIAVMFIISLFPLDAEEDPGKSRDVYVSSGISDARILIPFFADDSTSSSICGFIYNGLTKIDKDLEVTGDLAESWEIKDGGLSITFNLRKNVTWHDGKPFTARDVLFTYKKILDPAAACPYISSYSDINDIKVLDEHTIQFLYSSPYAPALSKFGMGIIPEHLFKDEIELQRSFYATNPVGTGPYKFSIWKRAEYIILEANEDYFEHMPFIKRYVYRIIPDQNVQFLELVSGSIDQMDLNPYQFIYRSETPEFTKRMEKYKYLARSYTYIGYNQKDPLFQDVRVRQALSYAINKEEIIRTVLLGLGGSCTGPFFKGTPYYDDAAPAYNYDPMKAALLLREAGWYDSDGDGILEKDGRKFYIKIATNQGNQVREDTATIVQQQWAKLGIKAEVMVIAWSAFLDQFIDKKNFQVVLLGWTIPVDPDIYAVWHTASSIEGGLNFVSYSNEEVDRLIEEGRREFDQEKRGEIYRNVHLKIAQDAPYTFLFFPYATPAVQNRFKGIEPGLAGIGYNFIDCNVPKDEVKYKF